MLVSPSSFEARSRSREGRLAQDSHRRISTHWWPSARGSLPTLTRLEPELRTGTGPLNTICLENWSAGLSFRANRCAGWSPSVPRIFKILKNWKILKEFAPSALHLGFYHMIFYPAATCQLLPRYGQLTAALWSNNVIQKGPRHQELLEEHGNLDLTVVLLWCAWRREVCGLEALDSLQELVLLLEIIHLLADEKHLERIRADTWIVQNLPQHCDSLLLRLPVHFCPVYPRVSQRLLRRLRRAGLRRDVRPDNRRHRRDLSWRGSLWNGGAAAPSIAWRP